MTQGLLISCKTKQKLFSKKLKSPTLSNITNFNQYNSIYNKLRRKAKYVYYKDLFEHNKTDIKKTWGIIREVIGNKKKQKQSLPEFFQQNKEIFNDPLLIANGFNTFFTEIGPQLAAEIPSTDRTFQSYLGEPHDLTFQFSQISSDKILQMCNKLKPKLSSGIDCISNKLLKQIAPIIIRPLHYLINLSLTTGFVPQQIKISKVIPVFKQDGSEHGFQIVALSQ